MRITDDVVRDLVALVESGEASSDTRALVEACLAERPALADESRRSRGWSLPATATSPASDVEREALRRTKTLLARRSWSMALGLLFTGLPLSFKVDEQGFRFLFLPDQPLVAATSLLIAVAAWIVFVRTTRSLRPAGF